MLSKAKDANNLTLEEHFSELKKRLLFVVTILTIFFGVCLYKGGDILALFLKQGKDAGFVMIALSPQEALLQQLRVSFTFGFLVSIPVIIYEIVVFVTPAVDKSYVRKFWLMIVVGILLFITGMAFAIYVLFPFVLMYMKEITSASDILLEISVENYISFFLTMVILLGSIFEIPMISLFLSNVGLISTKAMKKYRKLAVILILVIAAIITPPDVVSQVIVAVPMILLYEISILLCMLIERNKLNYKGKNA